MIKIQQGVNHFTQMYFFRFLNKQKKRNCNYRLMVLSKDIDKIHQSPNLNFNLGIRRLSVLKVTFGKFPGGPVIKTSVLSAGATGFDP